ncbi:MAG: acetyl-CoA C-acetyltransferase [Eubacteriales bacterium]|nr:acetyl-CoA C-acetyltransferase [Eubacteriales bacterium]MDD4323571.1 acetyl-CoA C-acetyltransferase [Eubacteriales bacterium]MDD4541088.1 acetyl-CoA C-acetyltransferase [Eubacteriales bacterium]
MTEIAIMSACRTAIGSYGGTLANVSAVELATIVIREVVERSGVEPEQVDEVLMGSILTAGLGQNVARQAAIKAGLPEKTVASTLNNVCGSGLKSLNMAAAMIRNGDADIMVVGGTENMSASPYLLEQARFGYRMNDGVLVDSMIRDALTDAFGQYHMGITAENVAEKYSITREEQDAFAYESQRKTKVAQEEGRFKKEIVPVHIKERKREFDFDQDEYPRESSLESLAKLRPAFKKDGSVTAGNSSGINDGAAAMLIMSLEKAEELGLKPMAILREGVSVGLDPAIMGMGPYYAVEKLMEKSGFKLDDIDLFELNEAFASQSIASVRELGIDSAKVNVNGGAIALGHPVGASGARILVTLLHEMERREARYGVASLCIGGGMGVASLIERYAD